MITGAQAIVDCLRREEINHVFGIPGTMNLPILDVLRETPEIRFILTRHEQRAFRVALAEPLGPVHLDASRDILLDKTESEPLMPGAYRPLAGPACSHAELDRACDLISKAKKPILLAGGGVLRDNALSALQRLAEATGIPVATLQYHPDAFPTTHALALGPLGRNGWSSANRAMPQADVVVAIGAHIDLFSTTFKYGIISREAKLIHHSPVGTDIGVVFPVAQAVVGSTLSFIQGLAARLRQKWEGTSVATLRREWDEELKRLP